MAQGGIVPSPNSAFTPVRRQSPTPSPSPFYDFTGYWLEERSFLSSLCDEIGTVGDLQLVAASLGFKYSRVEQILTSFPHDFPTGVRYACRMVHCLPLHVLGEAGWSGSSFQWNAQRRALQSYCECSLSCASACVFAPMDSSTYLWHFGWEFGRGGDERRWYYSQLSPTPPTHSPLGNIMQRGSAYRGGSLWHRPSHCGSHHRIPDACIPQGR